MSRGPEDGGATGGHGGQLGGSWGVPGHIVGPRHVGFRTHHSTPSMALTSVHLIRPLKLVLNPMQTSTLISAKWANHQTDRSVCPLPPTSPLSWFQPRRRKSKQPRVPPVRSVRRQDGYPRVAYTTRKPRTDTELPFLPSNRSPPIGGGHAHFMQPTMANAASGRGQTCKTSPRFRHLGPWPSPCLQVVQRRGQEGDHRRGALIASTGTFDSVTTYCNMEGPVGFSPNLLEAPTATLECYHWPWARRPPARWSHDVLCLGPRPDCGVSALLHTGEVRRVIRT